MAKTHYHFGGAGEGELRFLKRGDCIRTLKRKCALKKKELRARGVVLSGNAEHGLHDGTLTMRVWSCDHDNSQSCVAKAVQELSVGQVVNLPASIARPTVPAAVKEMTEAIAYNMGRGRLRRETAATAIPPAASTSWPDVPAAFIKKASMRGNTQELAMATACQPEGDRILLYGPPSTGKTRFVIELAKKLNLPLYYVQMSEGGSRSDLIGHFVMKGSDFVWHDGLGNRAWGATGEPGILFLDELREYNADTAAVLLNFLNCRDIRENAGMTLPNGKTIKAHPRFRVVAAMNGQPQELPDALSSRFVCQFEFSAPTKSAYDSLPKDLRSTAKSLCETTDADARIDLRSWKSFASLRESMQNEEAAARAVFGAKARDVLTAIALKRKK